MAVPSRLTLALKTPFNDNKPTEASSVFATLPSLPAAAPSITTISSSSTSSLPSTKLLPTPPQQTLHVTTCQGEPSLVLYVRSRAPSADNTPTYYGGDVIAGNVSLNVTPKEAQYITSVEIEARFTQKIFPFLRWSSLLLNIRYFCVFLLRASLTCGFLFSFRVKFL